MDASTSPFDSPPDALSSPETTAQSDLQEARPSRRGMRTDTTVLLVTGTVFLLAGIALVLAPVYSWTVVRWGRSLSDIGIQSGNLILGGLVFFALGVLSHGIVRMANAPVSLPLPHVSKRDEPSVDVSLIVEQLVTEVAQVRTSTLQVAEQVKGVSEAQLAMARQLSVPAEGSMDREQSNALFRLAASLDQMNARQDERIKVLSAQVAGKLDGLMRRLQAAAAPPQTKPQAKAQTTVPTTTAPQPAQPRRAPAQGSAGTLEVAVDLDATFEAKPVGLSDAESLRSPLPFSKDTARDIARDLDALLPDDVTDNAIDRERRRRS